MKIETVLQGQYFCSVKLFKTRIPRNCCRLAERRTQETFFLFTEEFRRKDRTCERLWIHTTSSKI